MQRRCGCRRVMAASGQSRWAPALKRAAIGRPGKAAQVAERGGMQLCALLRRQSARDLCRVSAPDEALVGVGSGLGWGRWAAHTRHLAGWNVLHLHVHLPRSHVCVLYSPPCQEGGGVPYNAQGAGQRSPVLAVRASRPVPSRRLARAAQPLAGCSTLLGCRPPTPGWQSGPPASRACRRPRQGPPPVLQAGPFSKCCRATPSLAAAGVARAPSPPGHAGTSSLARSVPQQEAPGAAMLSTAPGPTVLPPP